VNFDLKLQNEGNVRIDIYTMHGQLVTTLTSEFLSEGDHTLNYNNLNLNPGQYIYRVSGDKNIIKSGSMIKLR
jgi:hypothetical protein